MSLWVSSRGIQVVFLKAGTLKCARLEFSGCRVKPRRPRSRRGFTRPTPPTTSHTPHPPTLPDPCGQSRSWPKVVAKVGLAKSKSQLSLSSRCLAQARMSEASPRSKSTISNKARGTETASESQSGHKQDESGNASLMARRSV